MCKPGIFGGRECIYYLSHADALASDDKVLRVVHVLSSAPDGHSSNSSENQ